MNLVSGGLVLLVEVKYHQSCIHFSHCHLIGWRERKQRMGCGGGRQGGAWEQPLPRGLWDTLGKGHRAWPKLRGPHMASLDTECVPPADTLTLHKALPLPPVKWMWGLVFNHLISNCRSFPAVLWIFLSITAPPPPPGMRVTVVNRIKPR